MDEGNRDIFAHYRWHERDTSRILTWRETLEAMCAYYGTFCGRWHSNEFWKETQSKISTMTEQQCRDKVIQIEQEAEQEADADLAYWRLMQ